jgi:addiction module HigA family antidote
MYSSIALAENARQWSVVPGRLAAPGATRERNMRRTRLLLPNPGEILREDFLRPMDLSQTAIGVPPRRINEIVLGKRAGTADTDLRLARYFKMSDGFFLGLQTDFELMQRRREIGDKVKAIRPRAA